MVHIVLQRGIGIGIGRREAKLSFGAPPREGRQFDPTSSGAVRFDLMLFGYQLGLGLFIKNLVNFVRIR